MKPTSEGGYKLFPLEKLFQSANGNFDIQKKHLNGKGCNVISAGESSNGIVGKTDVNARVFPGNTITIDMFGNPYYQKDSYKLVTHARVFSLSPINGMRLSERIGIYVLAQILYFKRLFSYNNMCSWEKVRRLNIELPLNAHKKIDFNFIESRVRELEEERVRELEAYLTASNFSDCSLTLAEKDALSRVQRGSLTSKKIKIVDFFKVSNSHNILKSDVVFGSGKTPYVTASEGNNSIVSYVDYKDELKEEGNTIMIGGKTLVVTYQPDAYFSNDSHNLVLSVREENARNENIQLYLVSALYKALKPKYHWGDSISKAKIQNDTFVLPVQSDGSIDYDFIENYINAVKKQTVARLKEFIEREHSAYMQVVEGSEEQIEQTITPIHIYDTYQPGRIPLYTLRAACGYFDDGEVPEAEGWIDATGNGFTPDPKRHFAIHAKGDSMLPKIKDGDICVFEWYNAGSRNDEIVLTQSREYEPEYGGKYTIKRYHSEKVVSEEGWQHTKVELRPLNPDFDIVELTDDDNVRTIGIFKCVL